MSQVAIVMGSTSDLNIMKKAKELLDEFGISNEVHIMSAHRTPDQSLEFAKNAKSKGIKVIIAGAGGAAHLAGVIASSTTLPIIAVPINSSNSMFGLDSLLSMVQMPSGVPVATVAIDGAKNAAILAVQIIGTHDQEVSEKLEQFKKDMEKKVIKTNKDLDICSSFRHLGQCS